MSCSIVKREFWWRIIVSTLRLRKVAGLCLVLAPFIYILGVELLHREKFYYLGEFLLLGWMFISLAVGVAAALTYRLRVFGFNCGSFLCWSVAIMACAWTLQANQIPFGAWLMYAYFIVSFLYGCLTLRAVNIQKRNRSKGCSFKKGQ